jgi:hypothetical protein
MGVHTQKSYVDGHAFHIVCGYDAVEEELDCQEICSWGSTVAGVVDNAVLVFLSLSVDTHNSSIGVVAFAVLWNVHLVDEIDCFCCCC